jgi:hypothetical protein
MFSLLGRIRRPNNNIYLLEYDASHHGMWASVDFLYLEGLEGQTIIQTDLLEQGCRLSWVFLSLEGQGR